MTTIGRNQPCPCGSGKKYKKCCLPKDTAVDLKAFRADRAEEDLRQDILKFSASTRFTDEIVTAADKYHGDGTDGGPPMDQAPMENIRFHDWFINDHVHSTENKGILDLFGEARGKYLDEDQKALLEEWKASRLGAFEVESTEDGVLKLAAVFGDDTYSIEDESACEEVEADTVIIARITSSWGERQLAGAPIILEADAKTKLVDSVNEKFEKYREDHPDADVSKFLSENTHVLISIALGLSQD